MKNLKLTLLTCLTLSCASGAMAQHQHAFIWDSTNGMTDLGTLGGDTSNAFGINDSGQVVGYSYLADNVTYHAFIWSAATGMVDLGTDNAVNSRAWAINSAGDVVGDNDYAGIKSQLPFYWSPGGGFVLIGANLQRGYNFAFGINDASEVTGQFYAPYPYVRAFSWSASQGDPPRFLAGLPGGGHESVGNGINNLHHITGTANLSNGRFIAFFWNGTRMSRIAAIAGNSYTAGEAINDNDEVVGVGVDSAGQYKVFTGAPPRDRCFSRPSEASTAPVLVLTGAERLQVLPVMRVKRITPSSGIAALARQSTSGHFPAEPIAWGGRSTISAR